VELQQNYFIPFFRFPSLSYRDKESPYTSRSCQSLKYNGTLSFPILFHNSRPFSCISENKLKLFFILFSDTLFMLVNGKITMYENARLICKEMLAQQLYL